MGLVDSVLRFLGSVTRLMAHVSRLGASVKWPVGSALLACT